MIRLAAFALVIGSVAACTEPPSGRHARVVQILAEDNYEQGHREPDLVAKKLVKMQRGPYEWLRGTAAVFWGDVMAPGSDARYTTTFGSPRASRVLLVGDPHPENAGTFRTPAGDLVLDWNDFDATGYGPFTGDVRRLGAGLAIVVQLGAPGDDALTRMVVLAATSAYASAIAELADGGVIAPVGPGAAKLVDKELKKARERGDAKYALDEFAPLVDGTRQLALGDLEDVAADGVIEDRVEAVDADTAALLDAAIAKWDPTAHVALRARRIGSGVSSYAAYRYDVVLDDDRLIELKETRDGVLLRGVPQRDGSEWATPEARAVDTQHRLQASPDYDALLGGALGFKIRDREAYQRGIDAGDLEELAGGDPDDRAQLVTIAGLYGRMLARAHGEARTADGDRGVTAIAPLLADRADAFAAELADAALADAERITKDWADAADRDLAAEVLP